MDKQLFLAIGLSMAVLVVFYTLFPPTQTQTQDSATPSTTQSSATPSSQTPLGAKNTATQGAPGLGDTVQAGKPFQANGKNSRPVSVKTPLYEAVFDTEGGRLKQFFLQRYLVEKNRIDWGDVLPVLRQWLDKSAVDETVRVNLVNERLPHWPVFGLHILGRDDLSAKLASVTFTSSASQLTLDPEDTPKTLRFSARISPSLAVVKTFSFNPKNYVITQRITLKNLGNTSQKLRLRQTFGDGPDNITTFRALGSQVGPIWYVKGEIDSEDSDDITPELRVDNPQWAGITDSYFVSAARKLPDPDPATTSEPPLTQQAVFQARPLTIQKEEVWEAAYGFETSAFNLAPNASKTLTSTLYLGPKRRAEMRALHPSFTKALDLPLAFIAEPLLALLHWLHGFTANYGWAIVLLTVCVRIALFPFTYKGMLTMKKMQKLQPRMASLKTKYANNREKLNQEMITLYRKQRVNPLGGCLPILLQIPIFFALYSALLGAVELRHSPFIFWIVDLSAKDGLYVLPMLMGVTMFLQQRMTPSSLDPTQQKIMQWAPLIFLVFVINFPAGLVLYWTTSNLLSIVQQVLINRAKVGDVA